MSLNFWGFGRKVFNSVFESAFKMWETTLLFFLGFSIFSRNLSFFVDAWVKNFRQASQNIGTQMQKKKFLFFSQRNGLLFSGIEQKTLIPWAKRPRKNPHSFFFRVQRTFWSFFSKTICFFFGVWEQNLLELTKNVSARFLKVHSRFAKECSSLFPFLEQLIIFSKPEQFSLADWVKSIWHWSQKCTRRVRRNNLELGICWTVSLNFRGFGSKVFNGVLHSEFKIRKSKFLFFLGFSFFPRNLSLSFFVDAWAKNFRQVFQKIGTQMQKNDLLFFPKGKSLLVSGIEQKTLIPWAKRPQNILTVSVFVCRGQFGPFFSKTRCFFLECESKIF